MLGSYMVLSLTIRTSVRLRRCVCSCRSMSTFSTTDGISAATPESLQDLSSSPSANQRVSVDRQDLDLLNLQAFRRAQAHQSVIVQVASIEVAGVLHQTCHKMANVQAMFHYRHLGKEFILMELGSRESTRNLVASCSHWNRDDIIPVRTRLLDGSQLRSKSVAGGVVIDVVEDLYVPQEKIEADLKSISDVSQQMQVLYERSKLSELGTRLRFFIASQLEETISGIFPCNRVYLFGSSINGFGNHNSDVDMILDFDVPHTEKIRCTFPLRIASKVSAGNDRVQTKRSLELLADHLQYLMPGFTQMQRILLARVPIIKFFHEITGIRCDLSISNMSGLAMSNYLFLLGKIDYRLCALIVTIRRWAEANRLTSIHPGRWISNFTLTMMVVFFMQQKNLLPSFAALGKSPPSTFVPTLPPSSSDLSRLLFEFFTFYANFDYKNDAISVIDGKVFHKTDFTCFYIKNPVETELNICKNLSADELDRVIKAMESAIRVLESGSGIPKLFMEVPAEPKLKQGDGINVQGLFTGKNTFVGGSQQSSAGRRYFPDQFSVQVASGAHGGVPFRRQGGGSARVSSEEILRNNRRRKNEQIKPWRQW